MLENLRLIDLSVPLEDGAASEPMPARIRYVTHDGEGRRQTQQSILQQPGRGRLAREALDLSSNGSTPG